MAVIWSYNRKQGELTFDNGTTGTIDLYEGNCLLVGLNRLRMTPDGWEYQMPPYFFNDETHAKACLGLTKGYDDMFEGHDIHLTLYRNMWSKSDLKKLISLFVQRTGKLTLEILDTAPEST